MCQRPATTVHEIIPKSKMPKNWATEDNMVTLCVDCHEKVHQGSASVYENMLKFLRDRRLMLYVQTEI